MGLLLLSVPISSRTKVPRGRSSLFSSERFTVRTDRGCLSAYSLHIPVPLCPHLRWRAFLLSPGGKLKVTNALLFTIRAAGAAPYSPRHETSSVLLFNHMATGDDRPRLRLGRRTDAAPSTGRSHLPPGIIAPTNHSPLGSGNRARKILKAIPGRWQQPRLTKIVATGFKISTRTATQHLRDRSGLLTALTSGGLDAQLRSLVRDSPWSAGAPSPLRSGRRPSAQRLSPGNNAQFHLVGFYKIQWSRSGAQCRSGSG